MYFRIIFGHLFFILSSSTTVSPSQEANRIIGGVKVNIDQCPSIVSVMNFQSHHCGGSLVRVNWVMTAAHCACIGIRVKPVEMYLIVAGTSDLYSNIREANTRKVQEVYVHPDYDDNFHSDIALLKLKVPFYFNVKLHAAKLFSSSQDYRNENPDVGRVFGWGSKIPYDPAKPKEDDTNDKIRKELNQVTVPFNSKEQCVRFCRKHKMAINPDSIICSGGVENKDACQGDSGGPLMFKEYLVGVVSWGIGCGIKGFPGVYTKVDYFLPWVNDTFDGRNIPSAVEVLAFNSGQSASGYITKITPLWLFQILIWLLTILVIL